MRYVATDRVWVAMAIGSNYPLVAINAMKMVVKAAIRSNARAIIRHCLLVVALPIAGDTSISEDVRARAQKNNKEVCFFKNVETMTRGCQEVILATIPLWNRAFSRAGVNEARFIATYPWVLFSECCDPATWNSAGEQCGACRDHHR